MDWRSLCLWTHLHSAVVPLPGDPRFPLCFMTNGGGVTEATKAQELATWLDVDVREDQARLLQPLPPCLPPLPPPHRPTLHM